MGKYDPLRAHLRNHGGQSISMTFRQIEGVLGFALPKSAHQYPEWWANNPMGHTHAESWLNAGYQVVSFQLHEGVVVFRRLR